MIKNKIDFALVITAQKCNPNGDPINGNRPRITDDGFGEMSDVCLKRKIRNRLRDMGHDILIDPSDNTNNGYTSTRSRVDSEPELKKYLVGKDVDEGKAKEISNKRWIDVRSFGQIFALRGAKKDDPGCSIGIRGPVTIGMAVTLEPVNIETIQITKSVNTSESGNGKSAKDSSTFGVKYMVEKGVYVAYGSIFPQLASLTGFDEKDAESIKYALSTIFENDAAQARPSGSMDSTLYWWTIPVNKKQWSSAKVHRSLNIVPSKKYPYYECNPGKMDNVTLEILE